MSDEPRYRLTIEPEGIIRAVIDEQTTEAERMLDGMSVGELVTWAVQVPQLVTLVFTFDIFRDTMRLWGIFLSPEQARLALRAADLDPASPGVEIREQAVNSRVY